MGNPGVFQLYPYPYPPNPYPWPGVRVLEGKCTGLHGFGEFGGFGKFCRLMSLKTYIHICIARAAHRTVYLIFDLLNGMVREKKRVYGYYINNWERKY